jgi:hypothetical protein
MLRAFACIGLSAALTLPSMSALGQTGYGVSPGAPSTSTFDRAWNRANESKERARASASYVRRHNEAGTQYHHRHYAQ